MLRKTLFSITVALLGITMLVMSVAAQTGSTLNDEDTDGDVSSLVVVQDIVSANVTQTVPITLTLSITGPDGPVTVEVPISLALNIRIGLSPQLTATVDVTSTVVTDEDGAEGGGTDDATDEEDVADAATPTATATTAPATPTPTEEATTEETTTDEAEATATPLPPVAEPTATSEITVTLVPTNTPEPVVAAPSCPDPRAVITSPGVNQVVSGTVDIYGTAENPNFQYYKVEYAEGADVDPDSTFAFLADARVQITGGLLTSFDSTNFANGPYTIKLTVVDNSGNFPPPCAVSIVIEN